MSSFYQELGAIEDDKQEKKRQKVNADRLNASGHDQQLRLEQPRPKSAAKRPKCEPEIGKREPEIVKLESRRPRSPSPTKRRVRFSAPEDGHGGGKSDRAAAKAKRKFGRKLRRRVRACVIPCHRAGCSLTVT